MSRIYVASSWRNRYQPDVVAALRQANHDVYDFRNPTCDDHGFAWSEIDPAWQYWTPSEFREALRHPVARHGFESDAVAVDWAEVGVLVLPCGRSAHLEAGYMAGAGKPLHILMLDQQEPELMYRWATAIHLDLDSLVAALGSPVAAAANGGRG